MVLKTESSIKYQNNIIQETTYTTYNHWKLRFYVISYAIRIKIRLILCIEFLLHGIITTFTIQIKYQVLKL